jgi:hypothetical protein
MGFPVGRNESSCADKGKFIYHTMNNSRKVKVTVARFLDLWTKWSSVVAFTIRPLYLQHPLEIALDRPQSRGG